MEVAWPRDSRLETRDSPPAYYYSLGALLAGDGGGRARGSQRPTNVNRDGRRMRCRCAMRRYERMEMRATRVPGSLSLSLSLSLSRRRGRGRRGSWNQELARRLRKGGRNPASGADAVRQRVRQSSPLRQVPSSPHASPPPRCAPGPTYPTYP
jgi:hypothetical protein